MRLDARAIAEVELAEDDSIPANWTLQTEEIRLVESVSGYPHVEIRWRPATRREVRDSVSTYQRSRADEIKERMNKLYASEVSVGYFDAPKADGNGHVLSVTGKDGASDGHIETSEEPHETPRVASTTHYRARWLRFWRFLPAELIPLATLTSLRDDERRWSFRSQQKQRDWPACGGAHRRLPGTALAS